MNLYLVFHYRIEHDFIFDYEMTKNHVGTHLFKVNNKDFQNKVHARYTTKYKKTE